MTELTRRNVLRYGIAIDLVIVATGVGMVVPPTPLLLIVVFTGAILLSAWKGGWKGGLTALTLSILALLAVFPDVVRAPHVLAVTLLGLGACGAVVAMKRRPAVGQPADVVPAESPAVAEAGQPAEQELSAPLHLVAPLEVHEEEERVAREREEERARIARAEKERLTREREEAEREAAAARARAEEERQRVEVERRRVEEERKRIEAERVAAEEARQRAEAERQRVEQELAARLAHEREEAERALQAQLAEEQQRVELERQRIEEERKRIEAERVAAEEARQRAEAERQRVEQEMAAELARQRELSLREVAERLEAERRAAEEDARRQLEAEREQLRIRAEQELAAERVRVERETIARIAATTAPPPAPATPRPAPPPAAPKPSLLDTVAGWFKPAPKPRTALNVHRNGDTTSRKRAQQSVRPATQAKDGTPKPRLLMIERRRATADTIAPRLKQRGVEMEVVERWVDAVDELFRFRPNLLFLDVEHPEFEKIHRTITEKTTQIPIVLTGRSAASLGGNFRYAAFVVRPYDADELLRLAQQAQSRIEDLLAAQAMPRTAPKPVQAAPPAPVPLQRPVTRATPAPVKPIPLSPVEPAEPKRLSPSGNGDVYEVTCFSCRAGFDAMDADWCSCLAKERTLVCTNCLSCFCKAPPSFKEKFWVEAPPRLFERKTAELRKHEGNLPQNPSLEAVQRPLVLAVEDDEEIQAIVSRVCSNLGYGFIWATNGQDGLDLARAYRPNLILSDAFMPKLDGREMCRMLKEEPVGADIRMVVMTGLYTDTKYRSEAVKRFHVDDYIAKPVSVTELINLLQRHLEGVTGLPMQEDLHELHRKEVEEAEGDSSENDIPLSDVLAAPALREVKRSDAYEVECFNCQRTFDATRAEWCSCVGRDNTLACEHCGGCFCKAPATYRERFWIDAPPSLFERKMIGSKRNISARSNPAPLEAKRPLILLVEDDENVQLIVRTVVSSMGYGFVVGANGQEGLALAREYNPDLILSDAFMPKLDGREMCRLLKEDPATSRTKAIIMTGLYTDRKYRNEALDYFKVDDYVAKPLAVDDLIKLFKKHLPQEAVAS